MEAELVGTGNKQLERLARTMHADVVELLVHALGDRARLTPAVIDQLLEIYREGLRHARVIGELHMNEPEDAKLPPIDNDRSIFETQPGFSSRPKRR